MEEISFKKLTQYFATFCVCVCCIQLLCLILILSGSITFSISSFAVDSNNRVYVGTNNDIEVYEDGNVVYTINPRTSRSYVFTITEDGNILLSTASKIYIMDLEGNVIQTQDDPGAHTYNQLSYQKRKYISSGGDIYKLSDILGRTKIVKNNCETVYQISLLSVSVKVLLCICILLWLVVPVGAIYIQQQKRIKSKDLP